MDKESARKLFQIMLTPESDAEGPHISMDEMVDFVNKRTQVENRDEMFKHINACRKCNELFDLAYTIRQQAEPYIEKEAATTLTPASFGEAISLHWKKIGVGAAMAASIFLAMFFSGSKPYTTIIRMNLAQEIALKEQYDPASQGSAQWTDQQIAEFLANMPEDEQLKTKDIKSLNVNNGLYLAMNSPTKGLAPKEKMVLQLRDGVLYVSSARMVTTPNTPELKAILSEKYNSGKFADEQAWNENRISRLLAALPDTAQLRPAGKLDHLKLGKFALRADVLVLQVEKRTLSVKAESVTR